jgi:hypothetical protein
MSPIEIAIDRFLVSASARLRERGVKARPYWHAGLPRFTWRQGWRRGRVFATVHRPTQTVWLQFDNLPVGSPRRDALPRRPRVFSLYVPAATVSDPRFAEYVAECLFPRDPSAPAYPDGFLSLPAGCRIEHH